MAKIPEKLKEELLSEMKKEEVEAAIGENRDQLFVRIPNRIRQRPGLKKGDKIIFTIEGTHEKQKFSVKVVKNT